MSFDNATVEDLKRILNVLPYLKGRTLESLRAWTDGYGDAENEGYIQALEYYAGHHEH